jgi:hypothetical protein
MENERSSGNVFVGFNLHKKNSPAVNKINLLLNELSDIISCTEIDAIEHGTYNSQRQELVENSFKDIINAQLNLVKLITLE